MIVGGRRFRSIRSRLARPVRTGSLAPTGQLQPHRLTQRLLIICLAFAVPGAALLATVERSFSEQLRFSRAETHGTHYLRAVRAVLTDATWHSHALAAARAGDRAAEAERDQLARALRRSVADVIALHRSVGMTALDGHVSRLATAANRFDEAPPARPDQHSELMQTALELVDEIAKRTNLAQDPELASYYTMRTLVDTLPTLAASSSLLTRFGADTLARQSFSAEARTRLISLTTVVEEVSRRLAADLRVALTADQSEHARGELARSLMSALSATTQHVDMAEKLGRDAPVKPAQHAYVAAGRTALDRYFELWDAAANRLEGLLAARLARLGAQRHQALGLMGAAFLVIAAVVMITVRDARKRRLAEEELAYQALHDSLTGLPNRVLLRDRLEHALARSERTGEHIAVLFIDLDDFKRINDSLGHDTGDALLRAFSERLRGCLRCSDTPARLGGDEFAILLEDLHDTSEATAVAARIAESVDTPLHANGADLRITMSIGMAVGRGGDGCAEELLRNADLAMYRAKSSGKGTSQMYVDGMYEAVVDRLRLEADLRGALERGEFLVQYQPIVSLGDRRIRGVEALVRWDHPDRGLVPPLAFIPIAEESGLIGQLGQWVLDQACRQGRAWQQAFGAEFSVSVNVSARQLRSGAFASDVERVLEDTGFRPDLLVLEITETVMVADDERALASLQQLRDVGVRIAIDDFGTGFSSLSYLHTLPVDTIKVDRSFVARVTTSAGDAALLQKIVELSRVLGFDTVAEGIESSDQLEQLLSASCEFGQGYLFSRPVAPADLEALLRTTFVDVQRPATVLVESWPPAEQPEYS